MASIFTKAFLQTALENAVIGGAGGAVTVLGPHATDLLTHVPWAQTGSGFLLGALTGLLVSLSSAKVGAGKYNGVASFSPNVEAVKPHQ